MSTTVEIITPDGPSETVVVEVPGLPGPAYDDTEVRQLIAEKADAGELAPVATTGSYEDLNDKPTIPATAEDVGAETPEGAQAKADQARIDAVSQAVAQVFEGAPELLDTIVEITARLADDQDALTALAGQIASKIASSQKGVANGVGTLDASGKQPESQVPDRLSPNGLLASIGAPAHASETGVVNEKYPYGDLRRYGITPDGVTDWTTSGQMLNAMNSALAMKVPLFVPSGYYATSLLAYYSDLHVRLEPGAEFGGIIHIGGIADAVITGVRLEGTAVTYDRFGIYDCDDAVINGSVHCKADGAKNVTYPGIAGRGFHSSASAFDVTINGDVVVDDLAVGLPVHHNHAAFAVDGAADNPRGLTIKGKVWVKESQVHGAYVTGVGHRINEIRVDAYGADSYGDTVGMEDADSLAQSQQLKGVWLNRCPANTVGKIVVNQGSGSRPNAIYDVLIEDTGKSGSGSSGQTYGTDGKATVGTIELLNLTGSSRGIGIGDHGYIPAGNAQANVAVDHIVIAVATAKAPIAGYAAITVAENATLVCPDIKFKNLDTYEGIYTYSTGVATLDVVDVGNCKNRVLYAAGRVTCRDLRFRTISSGSAAKVEFATGAEFSDVGLYADTGTAISQSLLKVGCADVAVRKMYGGPSAAAAGAVASTGARFRLERFKLVGNNSSAGSYGVKIEGADVYLGPGEATLFGTNFAKTAGALTGTAVQVVSSGAITANTAIPAATLATLGCTAVQL